MGRSMLTHSQSASGTSVLRPWHRFGSWVFAAVLGLQPASAAYLEKTDIGRSDIAVFVLNGQIVGGETISLQREISRLPSSLPVAVVLNSPGGNLGEGVKLGEFF